MEFKIQQNKLRNESKNGLTFRKEPSIMRIFPLSISAKTLEASNSLARPYDCHQEKEKLYQRK